MEIAKYNFEGENNIEFTRNSHTATVYLSQPKYITKIKRLKEKYPDDVDIVKENKDGTIVAHIPTKWIKISACKVNMSEERKQANAERLKQYRNKKG